ncbi:hypothetical protein ACSS6W_010310 [Trichoderma asperelloides]
MDGDEMALEGARGLRVGCAIAGQSSGRGGAVERFWVRFWRRWSLLEVRGGGGGGGYDMIRLQYAAWAYSGANAVCKAYVHG